MVMNSLAYRCVTYRHPSDGYSRKVPRKSLRRRVSLRLLMRQAPPDIYDLIDRVYGVIVSVVLTQTLDDLQGPRAEPSPHAPCC
jgi:hypothetical protein